MSDDATRSRVPDACGDPECEALCEPSGDGYSRCAAHATPKRVTNAELRREAERLAPFSPRARPHATPDRAAVDYLDEWAAWLQRNGFPFDGYTDEKPPAEVIRRLAEKWHADEGEHVEDYIHMFEEYGWNA